MSDIIDVKLPLSRAKKHPDYRVTLCNQNDTTNVDFVHIESEKMPIFRENMNIYQKFFPSIGLSIW
jgi:hypothetical protein